MPNSPLQRVLVTGITGAIGQELAQYLVTEGHAVCGLSRTQPKRPIDHVQYFQGDVATGLGLDNALEGVDTAYYLIHSMERDSPNFLKQEEQSAHYFCQAAHHAGVKTIIYLGGLAPPAVQQSDLSLHLQSRLNVENIVLNYTPTSLAFRASIVIGAKSRSFALLVRLLECMRAIPLPPWSSHRTAPVDIRDAVRILAKACTEPTPSNRSLDLAGPEIVSYQELIQRIMEQLCIARPFIKLSENFSPVTEAATTIISQEDATFVYALMKSLQSDLLPREGHGAIGNYSYKAHSLNAAIGHALLKMEEDKPLAAW